MKMCFFILKSFLYPNLLISALCYTLMLYFCFYDNVEPVNWTSINIRNVEQVKGDTQSNIIS